MVGSAGQATSNPDRRRSCLLVALVAELGVIFNVAGLRPCHGFWFPAEDARPTPQSRPENQRSYNFSGTRLNNHVRYAWSTSGLLTPQACHRHAARVIRTATI